ncbi:MAG: T9SS type A sorting domain-containing protein [Phaeodactylibacter sp.]|nr:T9SS type A sorting domain-containing protein [Phaeodactylibacter sp.]
MKKLLLLSALISFTQLAFGQYIEDFAGQTNKGIRGTCTDPFDPALCATSNLTDIDWTVVGTDLTNLTDANDYFIVRSNEAMEVRDVDNLVCWVSPMLDITDAAAPLSISVDYRVTNFDITDQFSIIYSLDGSIPIVGNSLIVAAENTTQQGNLEATGIPAGSELIISICANINSNNERVNFDNITIPNDFVNILPIALYSFEAKKVEDQVLLTWITSSEENNDYMAVERSQNGIDFFEIGQVPGRGTTDFEQEYQFLDTDPQPGLNYYRLRQVDFDGSFEYHRVVVVEMEGADATKLRLIPNPVGSTSTLSLGQSMEDASDLYIYNNNGQLVLQQKLPAGIDQQELDLSELAPGAYHLKWVRYNEVQLLPFVKQ